MTHFPLSRKIDYTVALLSPILAYILTFWFQTGLFVSILLYFILPAAYFTLRKPSIFRKAMVCALIAIPTTLIIDFFAIADRSWWVETIFPYRFLNGISIEVFVWFMGWFYFVVAIYETFFDRKPSLLSLASDAQPHRRAKWLL